jgi:hypothetical protein
MITKTITFNNIGNEAIVGHIAEINLTSVEFNFSKLLSGNYMHFIDNGVNLTYYVAKFDKVNSKIKVFVEVDLPADAIKTITYQSGVISDDDWSGFQLMNRRESLPITKSLYKMDYIQDSMGVGENLTLVNSLLKESPRFGNVLDCNGVNGYATIAREFDHLSTYDLCTISFSFALKYNHTVGSGVHTLFSKYVSGSNYLRIQLLNNGKLSVIANTTGVSADVFWQKFEPHSITIRINKAKVVVTVDNIQYVWAGFSTVAGGQPFTFGSFNNGSISEYTNAYFWDVEFTQGQYFIGDQFAREKWITKKPTREYNKWELVTEVPNTDPDNIVRQEPNIITVGSELHLYSTDRSVTTPGISRRISTDNGVTWSSPAVLTIVDMVGNTQRPFVFEDEGKIYIIYQRNLKLYISESVDGLIFNNPQIFLEVPADYTSIENSCVIWDEDDGKYYGMIDGAKSGLWKTFIISGDTLLTMTRLYNIDSFYSSYDSSGGPIVRLDGGGFLRKLNGIWNMWGHSYNIFRCKNNTIANDTWSLAYPNNAIFVRSSKWAQEQCADFSMCEKGGVCYAAVNNSGDNYNTTGNTSIYKYNGTMEQLVSDLSISVS